jgi:hypothetical protein
MHCEAKRVAGLIVAHLVSVARGEWRPLSDSNRKSVGCRRRRVYEFMA